MPMDEQQHKYYCALTDAAQKSQDSYDKTIIAISGGAFGLTLSYMKDFVADKPISSGWELLAAWAFWTISISVVLFSFYSGGQAHLKAAEEYAKNPTSFNKETAGGKFNSATKLLNFVSGLTCVLGLISIMFFVGANFEGARNANSQKASSKETSSKKPVSKKPAAKKPAVKKKPPAKKKPAAKKVAKKRAGGKKSVRGPIIPPPPKE